MPLSMRVSGLRPVYNAKILGVGTDIVHLPRVSRLLSRYPISTEGTSQFSKLARKFMHETEYNHLINMRDSFTNKVDTDLLVRYIAGVWASKEAAFKCLNQYVPKKDLPPAQTIYTKLLLKSNDLKSGKPVLKIDSAFSKEYPNYSQFYRSFVDPNAIEFQISLSHDGDYLIVLACIQQFTLGQI